MPKVHEPLENIMADPKKAKLLDVLVAQYAAELYWKLEHNKPLEAIRAQAYKDLALDAKVLTLMGKALVETWTKSAEDVEKLQNARLAQARVLVAAHDRQKNSEPVPKPSSEPLQLGYSPKPKARASTKSKVSTPAGDDADGKMIASALKAANLAGWNREQVEAEQKAMAVHGLDGGEGKPVDATPDEGQPVDATPVDATR